MTGRAARLGAAAALALLVSGCEQGRLDLASGGGGTGRTIDATASIPSTVALVSLEGAPDPVATRFRGALSDGAAAHALAMADPRSARYLARAYLSAYPAAGDGVQVAYAYDLFDARDHGRRQRVADTLDVPGDPADPWAAVTPAVLATLAGRSADALAASLSTAVP